MTTQATPTRTAEVQQDLRRRAAAIFPGGVNSPVRAFRAVGRDPLMIERGDGPYVWDADGNRYIDLIGSWGPAILGHANAAVVEAVRRQALDGFSFGATHRLEIELGERIRDAVPSMERLRFTSSGTEAVMSAVRLARAATGRELIVKFAGAYHGHVDALLAEAGSGLATLGIPGSAGVPAAAAASTIVVPFNDPDSIRAAFARHGGGIAAVIVEPIVANAGVIEPLPAFLELLRQLTTANGTVLIFDEVITGFRVGRGGAQAMYRVMPDLTTLGKIIGGGLPVGAYGGRLDLMELVAPIGPVYQAGTLSGHPLAMAAGIATLDQLTDARYAALTSAVEGLADRLNQAVREAQARAAVAFVSPLLTIFFRDGVPNDAAQALASDREAYAQFFGAMLERGVLLPPSQFEAWFPGFAHGAEQIESIVEAANEAVAAAA